MEEQRLNAGKIDENACLGNVGPNLGVGMIDLVPL